MKHIVIFASGTGTNAETLMKHFKDSPDVKIVALFSNNPDAGVLQKAVAYNIPSIVFRRDDLTNGEVLKKLRELSTDFIVLAGFLRMIPQDIVSGFRGRIINLHPALLPKFGGKGMHGLNVHRSVLESGESETGITIHYVDEHYDSGDIIEQHQIRVEASDTPESLAAKVQSLEHRFFPLVVERIVKSI